MSTPCPHATARRLEGLGVARRREAMALLRAILPRVVTVHAKAVWSEPGVVDAAALQQCLDWVREAGFTGTYVLIFDAVSDERASVLHLADVVCPYLAA